MARLNKSGDLKTRARLALVGGSCAVALMAGLGTGVAAAATSPTTSPSGSSSGQTVSGKATFFGDASEYQSLACGGNSRNITQGVALWIVPCGTQVRITSQQTGKSVVAPVVDRGPASWTGAVIDLLPGTWDALGVPRSAGKQQVTYQVLGTSAGSAATTGQSQPSQSSGQSQPQPMGQPQPSQSSGQDQSQSGTGSKHHRSHSSN